MIAGSQRLLTKEYGYQPASFLAEKDITLWDGQRWVDAFVSYKKTDAIVQISIESRILETDTEQYFLSAERVWKASELSKMGILIGQVVDDFEAVIDYRDDRLLKLDRYDLGVLLARINRSFERDGQLVFQMCEKNFDAVTDVKRILSTLADFDERIRFSVTKNHREFLVNDLSFMNLKTYGVAPEVYSSRETLRGYIRTLFDEALVCNGTVKLPGCGTHAKELEELLLLFSVRSGIIGSHLHIYPRDLFNFFYHIGTYAEKVVDNLHKVWKGNASNLAAIQKMNWVRKRKIKRDLYEVITESEIFYLRGWIAYEPQIQ